MIKKLASCVGEYRKNAILTPVLVMLEVVMEVAIPLMMAYLIDFGIDAGNMTVVYQVGVILVSSAILSILFGVMAGKNAAIASTGFAKNIRKKLYHNVQEFSFSNIDKFSTSGIITRLTTDVTNVQQSFQMITRMAVRAPIMMVFSLFAAFSLNAKLSFIFLGAIPILGLGIFFIIKNAYPIFNRVFKTYDRLNEVVGENLTGMRVVKSFNREEHETKKFSTISEEVRSDFTKAELLLAYNMPLMQFCMYGCMLLISWFGARMIVASGGSPALGGFTTGELMSLISYATQILMSLMMLSMVFVMLTMSRASAERIVELMEEKSDLHSPKDGIKSVKDGSIVFEQVDFSYGKNLDKLVLKDVNLTIRSGETIGIIGGTGSSKSSLVQLIPRLYDATKGNVFIGGVDVKAYDLEALRQEVAMVLQKNQLFSGTIKENLRWGSEFASDEELIHACRCSAADSFVSEFSDGYDTYVEQGGSNLSGGQKQRLCIARALLKKPKILILDDSTSAVDTKTDAMIRQAFYQEIPNTTKLIIAQRISSVQDADKIIVMDNGLVTAFGTHEELLENSSIYREVYDTQNKGGKMNG